VVRRYLPEMHREAEERRQLETELRSALKNGELALAYQPIIASDTQKIEAFEALLRWTHPALGEVPPEKFVPIAEEAGLITAIGEWVIRSACAEAVKWPDNIRLSINLSPLQFTNPNLTTVILSSLSKNGLSPTRLEVEITEGVFLAENAHTMATLHQLEAIGVRIALDDFGTGYSSLGYLRKANFSKIKIDRSFVRGAAQNSDESVAIIRAVVALAGSLGMETTAEGAETEAEYESVRSLGCGQVQGFFFSHPMSAAQALALVSEPEGEPDLARRFG
jgi:EAL domain-containing protein (putative c-di-GMP-specific phosphodiesterase class I)